MTVLLTQVAAIAAHQGKTLEVETGNQHLPQQQQVPLLTIG